ncbi:MAG: hypothetical protein ACK5LV_03035 [Lachnospirales bacterium]
MKLVSIVVVVLLCLGSIFTLYDKNSDSDVVIIKEEMESSDVLDDEVTDGDLYSDDGEVHGGSSNMVEFTDYNDYVISVDVNNMQVVALDEESSKAWRVVGGELIYECKSDFDLDYEISVMKEMDLAYAIINSSNLKDLSLYETLEEIGISLICINLEDFKNYIDTTNDLTFLTQDEVSYIENVLSVKQKIDKMITKTNKINSHNIAILEISDNELIYTDNYFVGVLKDFDTNHNINVTRTVAELKANNPEHLFIVVSDEDKNYFDEVLTQFAKENLWWHDLDVVKNNDIVRVNDTLPYEVDVENWLECYTYVYTYIANIKNT